MPRETTAYFRVRSVLASRDSRAITLSPGRFVKDSETEVEVADDGTEFAPWEDCGPWDPGSAFDELGGKMTELRLEGDDDVILDLDPDDLVEVRLIRLDRSAEGPFMGSPPL